MDIGLIPDSAPFNPEQRAWLNGFLAGWIGLGPQGATGAAFSTSPEAPSLPAAAPPSKSAEIEPWHDPALAIEQRLQLAEGQPLEGRLMAAMAQLDCGSCGYDCRAYAKAIAAGAEGSLSLCSPGGTETAKAVKRILKQHAPNTGPSLAGTTSPSNGTPLSEGPGTPAPGCSRSNPHEARLIRSVSLNGEGSEKETRHVEIDLGHDGPNYSVGDSLGVFPRNCPALVSEILEALGSSGEEHVKLEGDERIALRSALVERCCLNEITDRLLEELKAAVTDRHEGESLRCLLEVEDDSVMDGLDVLDLLRKFPGARVAPEAFATALSPIRPRLYSISSSPKRHVGQVHLTVRRVTYTSNGRERKGVASTMLADRVAPGTTFRAFVQRTHGFGLPDDPTTPIIMIGPGTGIAPFRAFLHERDAVRALGKNWLIFGDQRRAHDFLYEAELTEFLRRGVLTRLDTAFSRDSDQKIYVQHRMIEHGATLFDWLRDGAWVYVCGDARRMAADVDRALRTVIREHGRMTEAEAGAYLAAMASEGRYRRDVY